MPRPIMHAIACACLITGTASLTGCAAPHRQLCAHPCADGWHIYATDAAFVARFPRYREPEIDIRADYVSDMWVLGVFDRATHQCWVKCANPEQPTETERAIMDHETCHAVEYADGWSAAAPLWAALARSHPSMMTHHDINTRLKAYGYWPSIFKGDF